MYPPKQFTEKSILLLNKETVVIKEVDISVTNNGCGRKWISAEGQPSYEKAYCDLVIKNGDSTIHAGADYKPVYFGNIEIKLEKMNPWGKEENGIPPGGCRIWVRKLEGR